MSWRTIVLIIGLIVVFAFAVNSIEQNKKNEIANEFCISRDYTEGYESFGTFKCVELKETCVDGDYCEKSRYIKTYNRTLKEED